jgi:large subunit ribosomal protein L22
MVGYSTKVAEKEAKAVGRSLPISHQHSTQVCAFIRGKSLEIAKKMLIQIIALKLAVPYNKSKMDLSHKKGIAAGRYPVKACGEILKLLESAEANAQFKGLSTGDLLVRHICSQRGPTSPHYGRLGRNAKRSHIEVVLCESKEIKERKQAREARNDARNARKGTEKKESKQ